MQDFKESSQSVAHLWHYLMCNKWSNKPESDLKPLHSWIFRPHTYIYSTSPPPLFPGETALHLQRVPSGNEMHLFILIPPQHFRCTINAQQATQWGMRGRHKNSDMCVCVCVGVTCVCGQVQGNRWSLFAHKGTKTMNANDDDDVEQDNARSYLPPPCGFIFFPSLCCWCCCCWWRPEVDSEWTTNRRRHEMH